MLFRAHLELSLLRCPISTRPELKFETTRFRITGTQIGSLGEPFKCTLMALRSTVLSTQNLSGSAAPDARRNLSQLIAGAVGIAAPFPTTQNLAHGFGRRSRRASRWGVEPRPNQTREPAQSPAFDVRQAKLRRRPVAEPNLHDEVPRAKSPK